MAVGLVGGKGQWPIREGSCHARQQLTTCCPWQKEIQKEAGRHQRGGGRPEQHAQRVAGGKKRRKRALIERLNKPSGPYGGNEKVKTRVHRYPGVPVPKWALNRGSGSNRFPNSFVHRNRGPCHSISREPGWERTLPGIPAEIFRLWSDYLKTPAALSHSNIRSSTFPGRRPPANISITIGLGDWMGKTKIKPRPRDEATRSTRRRLAQAPGRGLCHLQEWVKEKKASGHHSVRGPRMPPAKGGTIKAITEKKSGPRGVPRRPPPPPRPSRPRKNPQTVHAALYGAVSGRRRKSSSSIAAGTTVAGRRTCHGALSIPDETQALPVGSVRRWRKLHRRCRPFILIQASGLEVGMGGTGKRRFQCADRRSLCGNGN